MPGQATNSAGSPMPTPVQPGTTWVLVADRARARLLQLERPNGRLVEIESRVNPDGRGPERAQRTDRPPRVQESANSARHAIEPHTSLREKSAVRFARELVDLLEHGRRDTRYDRLVVIAPPPFLGALRAVLGKSPIDVLVAEIAHEMTTSSAQDIRNRLPLCAAL